MNKEYIVLGGLIVDRRSLGQLDSAFAAFRETWGAYAELKWTKISRAKLPVYKGVIDFFADRRPEMRFKSIVLNGVGLRRILKQVSSHPAALDLLQSDLIVRMFGSHFRNGDECSVLVDNRQSADSLYWVRDRCNEDFRVSRGIFNDPIREIRTIDSKSSWQIQVADVLMGAVASELNRKGESDEGSAAKAEMIRYLKKRIQIGSFHLSREHSRSAFTVLHWDQIEK